MTIMVDEVRLFPGARPPFHRGSCHLTTTDDDLVELHRFAALVGLKCEWFQPLSWPHYDLTRARRAKALRFGREQAANRIVVRRERARIDAASRKIRIFG